MKNKPIHYDFKQLSERKIKKNGFSKVQKVYQVDVICKDNDGKNEVIPSIYSGIYEVKVYHKIFWMFKQLIERYYEARFIAHLPSQSHAVEVQSSTPHSYVSKEMDETFEWPGTITSIVRIYI